MSKAHNSKEFFIGGKMVLIRPLQDADVFFNQTYQDLVASSQLTALGELQHSPPDNLSTLTGSIDSFVYVAVSEESDVESPMGLALYVKNDITGAHEMSVLVSNQYVGTRLAFELADSLIKDASSHHVMTLYTIDRSDDTMMRRLAKQLGMSVRLVQGGNREIRYSLQVDEHPGVVVF